MTAIRVRQSLSWGKCVSIRSLPPATVALREPPKAPPHWVGVGCRSMSEQNVKPDRESREESDSASYSMRETMGISSYDEATVDAVRDFESLPADFGRYQVLSKLGEGGMGAVYLADDRQLNRKVALKIPKFAVSNVSKLAQRFQREAQAAATLSHPNICPVFDAGEIDGVNYMAMGFVQGQPLSAFIRTQSPPSERGAAMTVRKIALALEEAHQHGVVHRDLKPANIMIDHRNEPIVMDFGLACQADQAIDSRLTQDGAILGSPAYMSPEQLEGKPENIGPSCDIYALGVLLFELLTGHLPYKGSGTMASIISEVFSKPTPDPRRYREDMDPRLAMICRKAIAKNVEHRFVSMTDFADSLTAYLRSEPDDSLALPAEATRGASITGSAELIRAREQYEMAQSLCKSGQLEAAAAVLERMSTLSDADTKKYANWAKTELVRLRERSSQTEKGSDILQDDNLWKEEFHAPLAKPVKRPKGLSSLGEENSWLPYLIAVSIGALIFMLGLILVGAFTNAFFSDEPGDPPAIKKPK